MVTKTLSNGRIDSEFEWLNEYTNSMQVKIVVHYGGRGAPNFLMSILEDAFRPIHLKDVII